MPTRNVVLTERQEQLVEVLVQSGRYQNASEVLRDGLRLIEQREAQEAARLAALRDAVARGIVALECGAFTEFADPEALKAHLQEVASRVIEGRRPVGTAPDTVAPS
jgi:antitoxin ParD1/3/4